MAALVWNFDQVVRQVTLASGRLLAELRARNAEGAKRVGISILKDVQKAYDAKSRKQASDDGIVWRDLARATLEARVRRRGPAREIVATRKKKAAQAKLYREGGERRALGKQLQRKGEKFSGDDAVTVLERERKELSAKLQSLVDQEESSAYEIGVDTGMQRSSGSPGFSDPVWKRTPSDNLGRNIFLVDAGRVTIGYDRTYSAAFDAQRPILPEQLPDPWRVEAELAFSTWADQIIQSGLN